MGNERPGIVRRGATCLSYRREGHFWRPGGPILTGAEVVGYKIRYVSDRYPAFAIPFSARTACKQALRRDRRIAPDSASPRKSATKRLQLPRTPPTALPKLFFCVVYGERRNGPLTLAAVDLWEGVAIRVCFVAPNQFN